MAQTPNRILIVDDDPDIRASLGEALAEHGAEVAAADGGVAAVPMLERFQPDVVISDVRMPEIDGMSLLEMIRERRPSVDVVLMTAYDDMATIASAMRGGAVDFLVKPIGLRELLAVTDRVFADRKVRSTAPKIATAADRAPQTIVGRDPRMVEIYKLIGQAAATTTTILIRGESGTGKELVARAVHQHSSSAAAPFVAVNCAALPSTLLESELFGHVRGAFTGAHENRRGRFALAGSGTIFLDEIGDTSLEFQTKLLRVIQDREYQPVGSDRVERADARVIAATHQDLESLIETRRFREDLYYRLRVVEIELPPLRDRPSDIPLLVEHIIAASSASLGVSRPVLSREAMAALCEYTWPGNVRELENCLKRAVVTAPGSVIRPEHLSFSAPRRSGAKENGKLASLDEVERDQVLRVLAATDNHKGRAAEILGVSRPRLRRLMEKYGIE